MVIGFESLIFFIFIFIFFFFYLFGVFGLGMEKRFLVLVLFVVFVVGEWEKVSYLFFSFSKTFF